MSTSLPNSGERVRDVHLTEDTLAVDLADGRTIIVPLAWYPRLLNATPEQRSHWKVSGAGYGIHWPEIDEDLSTEGLLRGAPAAAELSRQRQAGLGHTLTPKHDSEVVYTRKQRRIIDARLARALGDVRKGLTVGPFQTVDDAIASMKRQFKKRSARKNT